MRFSHPGLSEGALAAHFEYLCSLGGAQRLAYVPVVASGCATAHWCTAWRYSLTKCRPNALTIHYTSNDHIIRSGEMILMDAGCEYKCAVFTLVYI
jgi:intermediate cleaving peptidase 55